MAGLSAHERCLYVDGGWQDLNQTVKTSMYETAEEHPGVLVLDGQRLLLKAPTFADMCVSISLLPVALEFKGLRFRGMNTTQDPVEDDVFWLSVQVEEK